MNKRTATTATFCGKINNSNKHCFMNVTFWQSTNQHQQLRFGLVLLFCCFEFGEWEKSELSINWCLAALKTKTKNKKIPRKENTAHIANADDSNDDFLFVKCIWVIKSIELDPHEEWNPRNSQDIVNFSQCHSENHRNQYRRKPVQRPIGGKLRVHSFASTHTYAQFVRVQNGGCMRESEESAANTQHDDFLIFSFPFRLPSVQISRSNELDLGNFLNSSKSRGIAVVCSLSLSLALSLCSLFLCNSFCRIQFYSFEFACVCVCVAFNQQASTMYHDMGYPSHGYANYLAQYESSSYGDPTHFMHHLSSVPVGSQLPVPSLAAPPPPPPPPPLPLPYASDPLHQHPHQHQHLPIMHSSSETRAWYQPPLAITPHSDHRYTFAHTKKNWKINAQLANKPSFHHRFHFAQFYFKTFKFTHELACLSIQIKTPQNSCWRNFSSTSQYFIKTTWVIRISRKTLN